MSKDQKSAKKKPIVTRSQTAPGQRRTPVRTQPSFPLLFTKDNYVYMAIGCGLIGIGLLLMLGGSMKDPNVWDESVIYSARRTVLAPIFILAGLGVEIYAIFRK